MILNYSTTVPAVKTVGEIQAMLGRAGAATVATTYEGGQPSGVTFVLDTPVGRSGYVLPVKVAAVHVVLRKTAGRSAQKTEAHAERVAWRIAKDWLEAQLALVEAGLAALDEVMLPYQITTSGQTVYALLTESAGARAALERGGAP